MSLTTKVTNVLLKHTGWDYTDYDSDQIMCNCKWRSNAFLPRTREKAEKVFATHLAEQVAELFEEVKV